MNLRKINLIILIALLLINFSLTSLAQAGTFTEVIKGFKDTGTEAGYQLTKTGDPKVEFSPALASYVNALILLTGMLFLIMVIYGGFLWMTARGNEDQVLKGKNLIIQATIGLGIVIFARIVVELVIFQLGQSITPA